MTATLGPLRHSPALARRSAALGCALAAAVTSPVRTAHAETMLEWAKARGAVSAQEFEDDVGRALKRPPPEITRIRVWGALGLGSSVVRASGGDHAKAWSARGRESTDRSEAPTNPVHAY